MKYTEEVLFVLSSNSLICARFQLLVSGLSEEEIRKGSLLWDEN